MTSGDLGLLVITWSGCSAWGRSLVIVGCCLGSIDGSRAKVSGGPAGRCVAAGTGVLGYQPRATIPAIPAKSCAETGSVNPEPVIALGDPPSNRNVPTDLQGARSRREAGLTLFGSVRPSRDHGDGGKSAGGRPKHVDLMGLVPLLAVSGPARPTALVVRAEAGAERRAGARSPVRPRRPPRQGRLEDVKKVLTGSWSALSWLCHAS
jgi:hypothetical protein